MFHILYHTFCGKGLEVPNKHAVIKTCSLWSKYDIFERKNIKYKITNPSYGKLRSLLKQIGKEGTKMAEG